MQCIGTASKPPTHESQYTNGFVLGIRCITYHLTGVGIDYVKENMDVEVSLKELGSSRDRSRSNTSLTLVKVSFMIPAKI